MYKCMIPNLLEKVEKKMNLSVGMQFVKQMLVKLFQIFLCNFIILFWFQIVVKFMFRYAIICFMLRPSVNNLTKCEIIISNQKLSILQYQNFMQFNSIHFSTLLPLFNVFCKFCFHNLFLDWWMKAYEWTSSIASMSLK